MFNARQLMIFYFYGTCNQKATIIQFQKLKEKAKTEEPKKDIQDLTDKFIKMIDKAVKEKEQEVMSL